LVSKNKGKQSKSELISRYDRRFKRDRPEDNRSAFQRDRDRILFTSAFRRLAGVTQVFSAEEGHIFHNRLTHSLEVAQVGRRLCERLTTDYRETADRLEINPDVVEAACLAHDLGHPPFGHIAERLLDELVTHELADGFDGNAQSFRIVTKLAFRSTDVTGLNLTRATLNALLKYPWLRGTAVRNTTSIVLIHQRNKNSVVVQFEIHRASNRFRPVGNLRHGKEKAEIYW
jgi:predicted deoxyguanosinetriphosphate triphosphohydrolase